MSILSEKDIRELIREELNLIVKRIDRIEAHLGIHQSISNFETELEIKKEQRRNYLKNESLKILREETSNRPGRKEIVAAFKRHNARMEALQQEKLSESMRQGVKTYAYVYKHRLKRLGSVFDGYFYFLWGNGIRLLPINEIEIISEKEN